MEYVRVNRHLQADRTKPRALIGLSEDKRAEYQQVTHAVMDYLLQSSPDHRLQGWTRPIRCPGCHCHATIIYVRILALPAAMA